MKDRVLPKIGWFGKLRKICVRIFILIFERTAIRFWANITKIRQTFAKIEKLHERKCALHPSEWKIRLDHGYTKQLI